MSNYFHRLFNPHCPHCIEERKEEMVCPSCEVLKEQLERANHENQRLLDKLLAEPKAEVPQKPVEISRPINIPWNVRRQMLEAEDREKARILRDAPKPSIDDLEKELDLAGQEREKTS